MLVIRARVSWKIIDHLGHDERELEFQSDWQGAFGEDGICAHNTRGRVAHRVTVDFDALNGFGRGGWSVVLQE